MKEIYKGYTAEQLKTNEHDPEVLKVVINMFNPEDQEALSSVLNSKNAEQLNVDFELDKNEIEAKKQISEELDWDIKYVNKELPQFLERKYGVKVRKSPDKNRMMLSNSSSYCSVYDLILFRYGGKFGTSVPREFLMEFAHESIHYQSKSETKIIKKENGDDLVMLTKGVSIDNYTKGLDGKECRDDKMLFTTFINEAMTERMNREFLQDRQDKDPSMFYERHGAEVSTAYDNNIDIVNNILKLVAKKEEISFEEASDQASQDAINGDIDNFYKRFFSPFSNGEKQGLIIAMNHLQGVGNPREFVYKMLTEQINEIIESKNNELEKKD